MAFHEGFWVVAGTAAPIIALTAVVSLADVSGDFLNTLEAISRTSGFLRALGRISPLFKVVAWLAVFGAFNLILQTALLAVSLVSLADDANSVAPWLAIVAALGGLLLLAVSSLGVVLVHLMHPRIEANPSSGPQEGTE